ncbi:hypothetical protein EDC94DRAFT_658169 [Helicostylum pulchrum]|nr:hypothetical protein EDC94DRAFT_658169 [Helicostylum pulchrum]
MVGLMIEELDEDKNGVTTYEIKSFTIDYAIYANQAATAIVSYQKFPEDRIIANIPGFKIFTIEEPYQVFEVKQRLWEDLFNFNRPQKHWVLDESNVTNLEPNNYRHTRFSFSLQTDGHMVSVLFEKVKTFWIPMNNQDVKLQRRNKPLENVNTGVYPLYKNPTGIFATDHIIGIDPGARDIVCAVDCS